jgi:hypothetical protein
MKSNSWIGLAALGLGAYLLLKPKAQPVDLGSAGTTGFTSSGTGTPTTTTSNTYYSIFNSNNPISPDTSLKAVSFASTSGYAAGTAKGQALPSTGTPNTYAPVSGTGFNSQGLGYSSMTPIVSKPLNTPAVNNLNTYLKPQYQSKSVFA